MSLKVSKINPAFDYSNTYCEARFWRPTGLGNRLFSWARAKVYAEQTGSVMLSPHWAHLRGASILRGGINYSNALRKILLMDNFKAAPGELSGLSGRLLRRSCAVLPVTTLEEALQVVPGSKKQLVSFVGHTGHSFNDLRAHSEFILAALESITKRKWIPAEHISGGPFIGINVRLGNDFRKVTDKNEFLHNKIDYLKTPLEWYLQSLRKIREIAGSQLKAIIVSDGNEQELSMLLKEPNVSYSHSKSAIADLLILERASILMGAGRSSFSAWASFLGKMPTITIPGSDLQGYHISDNISNHFVGEFDIDNPSTIFYDAIKNIKNG